jgi:hypothetical protein
MSDFFDQETGFEDEGSDVPMNDRPTGGATCLVNGSYRNLETGAPFLQTVQSLALQAGFGKFKVLLNGTEVRPRTAPSVIESEMNLELRPFDEAG